MLNRVFGRKDEENQSAAKTDCLPGQSLTRKFVLHYGPVPRTDLEHMDLRIFGAVAEEVTWNWEQFNQLPRTDDHGLSIASPAGLNSTPNGRAFHQNLIDQGFIKPLPSAKYVIQHCEYTTTNLLLDFMLEDNSCSPPILTANR